MTSFIVKQKDLVNFLALVELKGRDVKTGKEIRLVENCLLKVNATSISVKAIDTTDSVFCSVELNVDETEQGEIPIGDIAEVTKLLDRFEQGDALKIICAENKIKIVRAKPLKRATSPHVAPEYITSNKNVDMLPYKMEDGIPTADDVKLETKVMLDADDVKSFLNDGLAIRKLSSSTYREQFTLSIEDNVLRAIVLGDNERNIESELKASIEGPDCSCVYSYGFTNIFNNLNGLVTLYIAAGRHIWINKEAENYKADFLLGCVRD